jgi:hypothetical protein
MQSLRQRLPRPSIRARSCGSSSSRMLAVPARVARRRRSHGEGERVKRVDDCPLQPIDNALSDCGSRLARRSGHALSRTRVADPKNAASCSPSSSAGAEPSSSSPTMRCQLALASS